MARGRLGLVKWDMYSPSPIIGVDEVGRGCLAGPVVAAAVILSVKPKRRMFHDSKAVSELRREELYEVIITKHQWAVGFATVEEIDRINIYHASLLAMRRAVQGLKVKVGHVLVDGKAKIPKLRGLEQTALVKGDSRAEPVSAASIIAKVTRDRYMKELAEKFPGYGFEIHKGYATKYHREQLAKVGPCPFHRRSFNWGFEYAEGDEAAADAAAVEADVAAGAAAGARGDAAAGKVADPVASVGTDATGKRTTSTVT